MQLVELRLRSTLARSSSTSSQAGRQLRTYVLSRYVIVISTRTTVTTFTLRENGHG
jgi:hypothetical protein